MCCLAQKLVLYIQLQAVLVRSCVEVVLGQRIAVALHGLHVNSCTADLHLFCIAPVGSYNFMQAHLCPLKDSMLYIEGHLVVFSLCSCSLQDTLILAGVISACVLFTIIYVISK